MDYMTFMKPTLTPMITRLQRLILSVTEKYCASMKKTKTYNDRKFNLYQNDVKKTWALIK